MNSISTVWTNVVEDNENREGFEQNGTFYNDEENPLTPRGLGFNGNYDNENNEQHCLNISDEVEAEGFEITKIEEIKNIEKEKPAKRQANYGGSSIPETMKNEERKRAPSQFVKSDPSRTSLMSPGISETAFSESDSSRSETQYDYDILGTLPATQKRMFGHNVCEPGSSNGLFETSPLSPSEARKHRASFE